MTLKKTVRKMSKVFLLLFLVIIALAFEGKAFFSFFNLMNILLSVSVYGIMICGSIFPLLVGGMDLSIGSTAAFSGILGVYVMQAGGFTTPSVLLGILVAVVCGVAIGVINGVITYYFAVPALLTTISTQYIFYALAQLITANKTVSCVGSDFFYFIGSGTIAKIPFPIFIMAAFTLIIYFVLNKTTFGRQVYAVGGNAKATRMMGINPAGVTIKAYILSGVTAAVAGLVLGSMNTMIKANTGYGYELYVFIGLMIGGINFAGGEGTIQDGIFGALLVGVLNNVLMMVGIDATYHKMVQGIVIIIAVGLSAHRAYRDSGLGKKRKAAATAAKS